LAMNVGLEESNMNSTASEDKFPDRMNTYMTTEHFTLQAARSIVNGEIASRVTIFFTTLSGLIIAAAFVAQIPDMEQIFLLFGSLAFPLVILLGFFTTGRLAVLGMMDAIYVKAISRIRHFYSEAAPETKPFLLFPPYDDERSLALYAGWSSTSLIRDNLLSAANMVTTSNSLVITVLVGALLSSVYDLAYRQYLPIGILVFLIAFFLHGVVAALFVRPNLTIAEYRAIRFPKPDGSDEAGSDNSNLS
ncbi:MAG: hypothetical protein R3335_15260, partial [Anaerolineales bacterium]|nr:hypothetical protein [Anaerolineales bacterium]